MAPTGSKEYRCEECGESFKSRQALSGHMRKHGRTGKQPKSTPSHSGIAAEQKAKCSRVEASTNDEQNAAGQVEASTSAQGGNNKVEFVQDRCKNCNRSFNSRHALNGHSAHCKLSSNQGVAKQNADVLEFLGRVPRQKRSIRIELTTSEARAEREPEEGVDSGDKEPSLKSSSPPSKSLGENPRMRCEKKGVTGQEAAGQIEASINANGERNEKVFSTDGHSAHCKLPSSQGVAKQTAAQQAEAWTNARGGNSELQFLEQVPMGKRSIRRTKDSAEALPMLKDQPEKDPSSDDELGRAKDAADALLMLKDQPKKNPSSDDEPGRIKDAADALLMLKDQPEKHPSSDDELGIGIPDDVPGIDNPDEEMRSAAIILQMMSIGKKPYSDGRRGVADCADKSSVMQERNQKHDRDIPNLNAPVAIQGQEHELDFNAPAPTDNLDDGRLHNGGLPMKQAVVAALLKLQPDNDSGSVDCYVGGEKSGDVAPVALKEEVKPSASDRDLIVMQEQNQKPEVEPKVPDLNL